MRACVCVWKREWERDLEAVCEEYKSISAWLLSGCVRGGGDSGGAVCASICECVLHDCVYMLVCFPVCFCVWARTNQCSLLRGVKRVSELLILFDRQVGWVVEREREKKKKGGVARWGGGFKEALREEWLIDSRSPEKRDGCRYLGGRGEGKKEDDTKKW